MKKVDQFLDSLTDETLKEAAETFFGKRKELEDEKEFLRGQAEKLKLQAESIDVLLSRLNYVLARGKAAEKFWSELGHESLAAISPEWKNDVVMPRAWTRKGRFLGLACKLYIQAAEKIKVYLRGRYVDDPEIKGKKRLTVNLFTLKDQISKLNESIQEVNVCNRPDDVLAFARRLEVEGNHKKKFTGSELVYDYDQDLCLKELDPAELGLNEYPELPMDKKSMHRVNQTSKKIYSKFKTEIDNLFE